MDTSLLVPSLGNLAAVVADARSRLPLTPFFFPPGDESELVTRDFKATEFIPQNRYSPTGGGDFDLICGHKAYQFSTAIYDLDGWHLVGGSCVEYTGTKTITSSYEMIFNDALNTVSVVITPGESHSGSVIPGGTGPWQTDTRTENTISQSSSYDSGDGCTRSTGTGSVTLSDEITTETIDGWLTEWGTKSYTFRQATTAGMLFFSDSYLSQCPALKTQSAEAGRYRVSGGQARARGAWFEDAMASGMDGSLAALWNGNFTVLLCLRRRKNAPLIYGEPTKLSSGSVTYITTPADHAVLYPNGTVEEELEVSTENLWAADFQEFEWNPASSPEPALALVPKKPQYRLHAYSFFTYSAWGSAVLSEVTFISRTGAKYRITLELGTTAWDEELGYVENWHTRVPLETSAATLRISYRVDAAPYDLDVTMTRIFRLEIWTGNEENPWVIIAETGHETLPSPDGMVSDKITTPGIQLLLVSQYQSGSEFGFSALDGSGGKYRKRTYRCHRTTPEAGDPGLESCGGDYPAGSVDFEYVEEYQQGQLRPKDVTELSATVGLVDWASEENIPQDYGSLPGDWDDDALSATLHRKVRAGIEADYGYSAPKLDIADATGEILETVYVPLAVSVVDGENITDWIDLLPPAAGSTVFVEGQRLIYTP